MNDVATPTPDRPDDPQPQADSLSASSISFQLLQVDIRQTVLVPPEYLRAYHEVNPELAAKIVEHNLRVQERLAEELLTQQAHVRELEKDAAKHTQKLETQDQKAAVEDTSRSRKLQSRGQWFAVAVTFGGFTLCGLALALQMESAAIWLGCSMVVALAGVFLASRLIADRQPDSPPENSE